MKTFKNVALSILLAIVLLAINKFYLTKHGEILYTKKEFEAEQSSSASKVEVSAEEMLSFTDLGTLANEYPISMAVVNYEEAIEAMEQYAILKTSSLQQENEKLRDSLLLIKKLAHYVNCLVNDEAIKTVRETLNLPKP